MSLTDAQDNILLDGVHPLALCSGSNGGNNWRRNSTQVSLGGDRLGLGLLVRAVSRNVAGLVASVARLASRAQWATSRSLALLGDVSQLSAGIALHRLGLAIAGKVIGAAALVACGTRPSVTKAAASEAAEASPAGVSSTAESRTWLLALALEESV